MIGTVVALGGGGFSMSEDDGPSRIDDHILELSGKPHPRACFIPTASGDADGYAQRFEAAFTGTNCWFEASSTDSYGPLAPLRDGLGFVSGSACPHYLGEPDRREKYQRWVASGELPGGYAVDDFAAVVFRDGLFVDAISERPNRPVFRVERAADEAIEHGVAVRRLRDAPL